MAAPSTSSSPVTRNEMRPVKYHYADTFWCTYIISVVSANIAELGMWFVPVGFIQFEKSSKIKQKKNKQKNC